MKRCIAIDIDETICDGRRYWFTQLSKLFGSPENLDVDSLIARYGYIADVEQWRSTEARNWFQEKRFDPELHRTGLATMPGAVEGVQALSARFDIVYMTMRPDSIVEATAGWLHQHQFPPGEIIASPSSLADSERATWKGKELYARFPQVVGIVDDHPDVARAIPTGYRGKVFLLGQAAIDRSDIAIHCCLDWRAVQDAVSRALPRELPR